MAEVEEDFREFAYRRIDSINTDLNSNEEYRAKQKELNELYKEILIHLPSSQQHLLEKYDSVSSEIESMKEIHLYITAVKDINKIIK